MTTKEVFAEKAIRHSSNPYSFFVEGGNHESIK